MGLARKIKPISYLKSHAADIARHLGDSAEPLVITQNGEAKLVVQDIASHEATQETMALLKILARGNRQIEEGGIVRADAAIKRLSSGRAGGCWGSLYS